jgi:hypothetical protein
VRPFDRHALQASLADAVRLAQEAAQEAGSDAVTTGDAQVTPTTPRPATPVDAPPRAPSAFSRPGTVEGAPAEPPPPRATSPLSGVGRPVAPTAPSDPSAPRPPPKILGGLSGGIGAGIRPDTGDQPTVNRRLGGNGLGSSSGRLGPSNGLGAGNLGPTSGLGSGVILGPASGLGGSSLGADRTTSDLAPSVTERPTIPIRRPKPAEDRQAQEPPATPPAPPQGPAAGGPPVPRMAAPIAPWSPSDDDILPSGPARRRGFRLKR